MPRLYLESFGCQMNRLDAENLLGVLEREGYESWPEAETADVILLNTCSVRAHAEDRVAAVAGTFKRMKRARPGLLLGILGCMAEREKDGVFRRIPHADLVAGPRALREVPAALRTLETERRRLVLDGARGDDFFLEPMHTAAGRATPFQAYVKAMEGCDMACAFCIVPAVRGAEVSRPLEAIVEEVRRLAGDGIVEVMFLGQTVNAYGKQLSPRRSLADLLAAASGVSGIRRIRFITSHPLFHGGGLFEAMGSLPRVTPCLHLPAQSGSDRILKEMKRGYTAARYEEIAAEYRERVPGGALASDFIAGYPGETEADHEASLRLIERVRFSSSFAFKFSPRPGTPAASLGDPVPDAVVRRRHQELLKAQEAVSLERHRARVGTRVEVLVEGPSKRDPSRFTGRTPQFEIANFEGPAKPGDFAEVEITAATPLALYGRMAPR